MEVGARRQWGRVGTGGNRGRIGGPGKGEREERGAVWGGCVGLF